MRNRGPIYALVFVLTAACTAVPALAATEEAGNDLFLCEAPLAEAQLEAGSGQDPVWLSSCTNCQICETSAQCGSGSCISVKLSPVPCEPDPVCALPNKVCSQSCEPCGATQPCGAGEGQCVNVKLAFCLPEETCHTPKVCYCP